MKGFKFMYVKHLNYGKYFRLPNGGLRLYMSKTCKGNKLDYRTPLFKKRPRIRILESWGKELDKSNLRNKYPGLMDFEEDMFAKCGPLSIQKP